LKVSIGGTFVVLCEQLRVFARIAAPAKFPPNKKQKNNHQTPSGTHHKWVPFLLLNL